MPKVGYVAIVGRPNAGKSTLINALIGEKVSAISPRPQTTQRTIPGIFTDEEKGVQIIFLDTPGIHQDAREQFGSQKSNEMHTLINGEAFASLREADIILRLVDPTRPYGAEDTRIDEVLSFSQKPVLRIETKQDLMRDARFKMPDARGEHIDFKIDSINNIGLEDLVTAITRLLPEGPYLYEADQYTDQTMDLRISEIIREQLFAELGEEVPYACYVEISSIEEKVSGIRKQVSGKTNEESALITDNGSLLSIMVYLNVESDSQKLIVIGKGGKKIQDIGTKSRLILEDIFGKKVFLALRVKVDKNWRKNEQVLRRLFPKK